MPTFRIRTRHSILNGILVVAILLAGLAPATAASTPSLPVVIQGKTSASAAAAVQAAGGTVVRHLDLVDAVAAEVTRVDAETLARRGFVVTPDLTLGLTSASFDISSTDVSLQSLHPGPQWGLSAGEGVAVAVVDTGVNEVPDLAGRVVLGPDLSGEADGVDRYGHGTFMAGLIAGDGSASAGEPVRHTGVAPGAHVVSVKVAGRDGLTSLSRVLAGIDWVVEHAAEHRIGVLNLSFGADHPMAWPADPLSMAVEKAWASGIAVVVSAGNDGAGTVTSPGRDPWVLAVGASDTAGTLETIDDSVPAWSGSSRRGGVTKPDLVAPGVSVVSLRAHGSTVDIANPSARVGDAYVRGSGTSMATALTSGAVAVLLADHPEATPDDLKGALLVAADPVPGSIAGALDLGGATVATSDPGWWQQHPLAGDESGAARLPWPDSDWNTSRWSTSRWSTSRWSTSRWSTGDWSTSRWSTSRWSTSRWTAVDWDQAIP